MTNVIKLLNSQRIYWRHDGASNRYRVWRGDWTGDQFEIIDQDGFDKACAVFALFGFRVNKWVDHDS